MNLRPGTISAERYSNILIIKPGAIGDLLNLTPIIRALHAAYPDASISVMVGSHATSELFKYNPLVRETLIFEKKGVHASFKEFLKFGRVLSGKSYDLVINFQRSNLKMWLLVAATLPQRILVYHKTSALNVHVVQNYLDTLSSLGISAQSHDLEFLPGPEADIFAEQAIARSDVMEKRVVALNPGASHPVNRWSIDKFAELGDMLVAKLGAGIIIIGGREDVPLADAITAKMRSHPLVLTGKLSLLQAGAILKRCELLVSADTGPLHLATAIGTRVVALFGAADPARTGPVGKGHRVVRSETTACVPCRSRSCGHVRPGECMDKISSQTVFETVADMLEQREGK